MHYLRHLGLYLHISTHAYRHIVQADAESGKHPKAMTTLLERQLNESGA